jgi:YbbR domain-containing protein
LALQEAPGRPSLLTVAARALARHPFTKLVSLLIAVALWSVLIASDGSLTREKVFQNVEVTVSGQDALKARGMIVMEDLSTLAPLVRIRADVPQSAYDRVTGANFTPRVDLSRVRQLGVQDVPVTIPSTSYGQVVEIEPAGVAVTVERYTTRSRIPVVVETTGRLDPLLWADTPRVDPMLVSVSGPAPLVEKVSRVVATADLSALTGSVTPERNAVTFIVQDARGNALASPLLQVTNEGVILDSVAVEVACYPLKELAIDPESAVNGAPGEGYELTDVRIEPPSVRAAASAETLLRLTSAMLDAPLELDGITETFSASLRVRRMTDVRHLSAEEVLVTAVVRESTARRTVRGVTVEVMGQLDAYSARLARAKLSVEIAGPYAWMQSLKDRDVHLYVSVAGLAPGDYELPVLAQIDNAPAYTFAPELTRMAVTISERTQ